MSESNNMNNGLIKGLSKNPIVMNFGAFVVAVVFALVCGIISWRIGRSALPYIIWSGSIAVFSAGVGFALGNRNQQETSPENSLRIGLIFLGGGIGFATAILGLFLPLMEYSAIFGGGLAAWRKNPNTVLLCAGLLFGGLALMFGSVMLAKNFEKSSVGLRRLLYGTNAFLTGMLLLTVLGVVNVLAYVPMGKADFFNRTFDFTASGLYSISESTQNFLANLKEPVKVYVLLPGNNLITVETETLLETFKTHSKKITWSSVSRDLDTQELVKLQEKYQIPDSLGLLVVYGSDQKPVYDFIKYQDLYSIPQQDMRRPDSEGGSFQFLGEGQLIKTMTFLSEGKSQAGVFFTQGNGELSIDDKNPGSASGIGTLWDETAKGNFKLDKITLDRNTKKIPQEADVLVMARPKFDPPPQAIDALRNYLRGTDGKKGRLLLLLDVEVEQVAGKKQVVPMPNLKVLLREFQVDVADDQIYNPLNERKPSVMTIMSSDKSNNPIAKAFLKGRSATLFLFDSIRTLKPLARVPNAPPNNITAEEILMTDPRIPVWAETDMGVNPQEIIAELRKDEKKAQQKLNGGQLPVAVAVTEKGAADPLSQIPGHESMAPTEDKPRMVVFGDSSWASNEGINGRFGESSLSLFNTSISWLRDRADLGAKPKGQERKDYRFNVAEDTVTKLKFLPLAMMLISVIGLGGAIWIVRRR
ncbi:MAG: hypothetical protein RL179_2113 [Planctomycetota bacterium]|jgi:hypothetical protein